jgi:acetate---CoA ligase (ADP-forming)
VAVVGASGDPAKWGHWIASGALRGAHRRDVHLVNRNGGEILGLPAYRALDELPSAPELVVIAVPAAGLEESVSAALDAGARAVVVISAGLGEVGEEGKAREDELATRVRAAGAVMLGPNCLGVYDAAAEFDLGANDLTPGPIGVISQSGNLALEISLLAADYGLGVSRFASLGNQADLAAADLVQAFADDPATRVLAVYAEDFRDGRAFARAGQAAAESGTPVVLLAAGASEAGARAARSHTGALVSDLAAVDAACRAAGIVRVSTPRELVDVAQALLASVRPRGRRVAVVGDGGGTGVIAADLAANLGLDLPALSDELSARLVAHMPTVVTGNPVDLAGAGEQDFSNFERVTRLVLASGEVDAVVLTGFFGGYSEMSESFRTRETAVAREIVDAVDAIGRPLVVQAMYWRSAPAAAFREGGIPVYREIEAALGALARIVQLEDGPRHGVPDARLRAGPVQEESAVGYLEAREIVVDAGVPLPEARPATSEEEALAAARDLGYPVALKSLGLLHKSDGGGVALGLDDADALAAAFGAMRERLPPGAYAVERMVEDAHGVELIVGCKRDPRFGPILLVGLGGVHAEAMRDIAVALAPAEPDEVEAMLRSLRGASLLTGTRGRPELDLFAASEAGAALSRLAAERPEIREVEVNPLLVLRSGVVGLDARAVVAADTVVR